MKNKKNKGFTLVELLVVIAIIAILVVLILVALGVARQKARDSQRKTNLNAIQLALELYNSDHSGNYPATGSMYTSLNVASYLSPMPKDPTTGLEYGYSVSTDLQHYIVCSTLEQPGTGNTNPYKVANGVGSDANGIPAACVVPTN